MTLDPTSRLPPELVTIVLDWLGQPDVLRAARISRRWRAIATGHPSFYAYLVLQSQYARLDSSCFDVGVTQGSVGVALYDLLQQPLPLLEAMDLQHMLAGTSPLSTNFLCGKSNLRMLSLSGWNLELFAPKLPIDQLAFKEVALPLIRCIQAPARLDLTQSTSGYDHELRIEGGGFERTFIRALCLDYELYGLGLEGLIAPIGERITHICVNWLCLRYYVNPTSSLGLTAVRRMEVDLTGLVRKRDSIFDYDVHRRHTTTAAIDIEWFDLDASSFQDTMPRNKGDTSSIDFVLSESSPTGKPIWLPAPKVLALAQRLGLHHLARNINLVLVHGVVIELEDVALLLTVFIDVTNSCACTDCIHEDYTIPV
ncbi:hypothetical protein EXIGLDRAFT_702661 [Exidia glandulosa HHB12029]|uniref:F-box domain-containing protein n=1 Tax=Exidia glandulosa HHB12029 TaxID=1314781 RepID=A0A165CF01_EXIGL|nr:hypothetical protein EXIGLDRAFT_702661 [Exidia glandulosa HHB12029]